MLPSFEPHYVRTEGDLPGAGWFSAACSFRRHGLRAYVSASVVIAILISVFGVQRIDSSAKGWRNMGFTPPCYGLG